VLCASLCRRTDVVCVCLSVPCFSSPVFVSSPQNYEPVLLGAVWTVTASSRLRRTKENLACMFAYVCVRRVCGYVHMCIRSCRCECLFVILQARMDCGSYLKIISNIIHHYQIFLVWTLSSFVLLKITYCKGLRAGQVDLQGLCMDGVVCVSLDDNTITGAESLPPLPERDGAALRERLR
jgi:hypothetical protein